MTTKEKVKSALELVALVVIFMLAVWGITTLICAVDPEGTKRTAKSGYVFTVQCPDAVGKLQFSTTVEKFYDNRAFYTLVMPGKEKLFIPTTCFIAETSKEALEKAQQEQAQKQQQPQQAPAPQAQPVPQPSVQAVPNTTPPAPVQPK